MTISEIEKLTPYADVNNVLILLTQGVTDIVGDNLIGLYLTGSLTYGDFNPESSDIDFLAIMKQVLSAEQLDQIKKMHVRIVAGDAKWSTRLEGSYITKAMLESAPPPNKPEAFRPYVNEAKVNNYPYGNEWTINLYVLYERGVALVGPDPKKLLAPVSIEAVREASKRDLLEEWEPKLSDNAWLQNSHYQAYVILTMCRILYRAAHKEVASKKVAAVWAKKELGQPWSDLIEKAELWHHGQDMDSLNETVAFIKFVISKFK